ncbi:hypothetical protein AVEN_78391-1 [Araneus ventricosus]|uniref:Beta-1,4-glucuronyltransferase 1 n=1 Tax=Araneus ventricosus TaxID=182803 RepID=A0A4Y2R035_ARAVE|nr:hypothetical protein AVEN_124168-1 [Araneus ventricosus]GBN68798.1 hypothetical protein AVEN_4286-1 [Araneus ventricosus]GBN68836.1 hypothetical protein AVEN_145961-1 [Araneus ventricosus]GBN68845.1 hypothetical protein AVEN_78391-1 [Araneus ventricosus]
MVPTRRRPSAQGIKCPTVHSGHIPATSHRVCELHVSGYKFSVLNNAFIVHRGLKTPNSFHKDKETDQEKNRQLFRQFKFELKEKYPDSSRKCY